MKNQKDVNFEAADQYKLLLCKISLKRQYLFYKNKN